MTNSSSSSFILAFKDDEELAAFSEYCNDYGYEELFRLVVNLADNEENKNKEKALDLLRRYYEVEVCGSLDIIDSRIKQSDYEKYMDYVNAKNALEESKEFKAEIAEKINKTDYKERKKQTEDAEHIISGTIWDTNGGLLEWAIRNGLLASDFRRYHVMCWNIG